MMEGTKCRGGENELSERCTGFDRERPPTNGVGIRSATDAIAKERNEVKGKKVGRRALGGNVDRAMFAQVLSGQRRGLA